MSALGFLTNKEAREKIGGLETRIAELEGDVTSANEALTQAQSELATANETLSEAQSDLASARERISELETENAKIPDLEAAAKATEEKTKLEAARLLAASGHPSALEIVDDGKDDPNTLTLAEFNSLTPAAKSKFSVNGGRITG